MSKLFKVISSVIIGLVILLFSLTYLDVIDFNILTSIAGLNDSQNHLSKPENEVIKINDDSVKNQRIKHQLYKDLKYWLKRKKWKIADLITGDILLNTINRTEPGWFDIELQQTIPCEDLQKIDKLWLRSSKKRFGYSVQKQVFLKYNDGLEGYNEEIKFKNWTTGHKQFATDVGWLKDQEWLKYSELVWNNIEEAPNGHLPIGARICSFGKSPELCWGIRTGLRFSLLSRDCFIN